MAPLDRSVKEESLGQGEIPELRVLGGQEGQGGLRVLLEKLVQ